MFKLKNLKIIKYLPCMFSLHKYQPITRNNKQGFILKCTRCGKEI